MNVLTARVAFRDRSPVDVLDLALRFLVSQARPFAEISAIVLLPLLGLSWLVARWGGWVIGWSVAVPLAFAARVPFTVLASRLVFEEQVRAREVLRDAARALPRILAIRVVWLGLVAASFAVFFAPALWTASALLFIDEVAILERQPILQTFARAARVAASAIGEALFGLLFLALLAALGVGLAEVGGRLIASDLLQLRPPPPAWTEGGSALALFGWFGMVPLLATARFFTYLNVRTRAEGWDIQTRFAAIAARPEEEP